MMRILLDGRPCLRGDTGIPRYADGVVRALPRLDRSRRYAVFSWRRQMGRLSSITPAPVVSSALPGRVMARIQMAGHPIPTWGLGRVDLFHATGFDTFRFHGARTIATLHDCAFRRVPECYTHADKSSFDQAARYALSWCDHIITVSNSAKADIVELYRCRPERITVVYPVLDERLSGLAESTGATSDASEARRRVPYILTVAEIGRRKNLRRLVAAYAKIAGLVPHDLVLVGPCGAQSDYPAQLRTDIEDLGLAERVHLEGAQPEPRLRSLYRDCDAFAFPSLYESFGFPAVEAMSWGKPTLTSATSAMPEVVADGAVLVDPTSVDSIADGLLAIVTQDDLRQRLAVSGRRRAALFSEANFVRGMVDVYERVL